MMKFFALVALTVFATASATSPTYTSVARQSVVAGAAGGAANTLTLTMAPDTALLVTDTITLTASGAIWTASSTPTCTATLAGGANAPTLTNAVNAAGTEIVMTLSDNGIATTVVTTIVCNSDLAANAATAVVYTFDLVTSKDTTAVTGQAGYTLTASPGWTSASRANIMTGQAGGATTFVVTPTTALVAANTITITADSAIWTASGTPACTATVASGAAAPTLTNAVNGAGTEIVMTLSVNGIAASDATTIVCSDGAAANGAATTVILFSLETTKDVTGLTGQTGWTITEKQVGWTSGTVANTVAGAAGGDLTFIITPLTALVATNTIGITASSAIWTASSAPACTATLAGGATAPTLTNSVNAAGTVITMTLSVNGIGAGVATTIVCTDNLATNSATVGTAVDFDVTTTGDVGPLSGQTGYTITAATSAASSTASVSMLTMLALAAVAMRQ